MEHRTVFFSVRKNQANTGVAFRFICNIGCYQTISFVVRCEFRHHLAVFINRIIIWLKGRLSDNYFRWQNLSAFNQTVFIDLVVHIPKMPENQFWQIVTAPGCCRESEHILGIKIGHSFGKCTAWASMTFIDYQEADLLRYFFSTFIKWLDQGHRNLFP